MIQVLKKCIYYYFYICINIYTNQKKGILQTNMWLENFQHKILAQISANLYLNFHELSSVKNNPLTTLQIKLFIKQKSQFFFQIESITVLQQETLHYSCIQFIRLKLNMNYIVAQDCLPTKSSYLILGTLYIMPSQNSKADATKYFQIIGKGDMLIQCILRFLKSGIY